MLYCVLKGNRIQSCHFDDKLMKSGTLRLWVSVERLILTVKVCVGLRSGSVERAALFSEREENAYRH